MYSKKQILLLVVVTFLALGIQTIQIRRPFVGHYASYQSTVMAAISRNILREQFTDLFKPKTDIIVGGRRSLHLNQYPFPSLLVALAVRFLGGSLEFWGRFQAVLFNVFSAFLLGAIATRLFRSTTVNCISSVVFLLSPYTLIYGQCFMSESFSICFLLFAFYMLTGTESRTFSFAHVLVAGLAFSIAVTGRIHFVLLLPALLISIRAESARGKAIQMLIFCIVALLLPLAWYSYTYFIALRADNVHTNIFMQLSSLLQGNKNLLTNLDYYKVVFDILSQMMLTPLLFPFLLVGLIFMDRTSPGFRITVVAAGCGALAIFLSPYKVMRYDFYLYVIFPFLVMIVAAGVAPILEAFPFLKKERFVVMFVIFYLVASSRFFCHPIFKHPNAGSILKAARAIELQTTVEDKLIVVGHDVGPTLYYTNRPAWSIELDLIGSSVALYQKNSRFTRVDLRKLEQLEVAMKNPISWVEYLRQQG